MYGMVVGKLPILGKDLLPPTSLVKDSDRFRDPALLVAKETRGSETETGRLSVGGEVLIPGFGNSCGFGFMSDITITGKVTQEGSREKRLD